jgi:hypothetical protein
MVEKSKSDNRWHSMVQGYAGMWGYPMFFAGTKPSSHTHEESSRKLHSYLAAKKHQMQADRSLGLLLNNRREIVHVIYMNDLPTADPESDALAAPIGLRPIGESSRPTPPTLLRATRRLRGKRIKMRSR